MYRFVRTLRLGAFFVCIPFLAFDHARAAPGPLNVPLSDNLAGANFKQFCPTPEKSPTSLYVLERAIVSSYKIPLAFLDWNDNGIGSNEFRLAVSTVMCVNAKTPAQIAKCFTKDKNYTPDATAQLNIVRDINLALTAGLSKGPEFDLQFKDGLLHVKHLRNASVFQIRDRSTIRTSDEVPTPAQEFFSSDGNYYAMTCKAKPSSPKIQPPVPLPGAPVPLSAEDAKLSNEIVLNNIRLRGSTADLAVSRDQDADFKNVSSATLSITNDNEAHTSTFDSHLALGYALPPTEMGKTHFQGIPYFKMDRSYIGGTGSSKTANNVDNVGFGLQENVLFPIEGIYGNLAVQPDFTYSLRSEAKVGKMQLVYEAFPPIAGFERTSPVGWMGLTYYFNIRALMNIGRVFSPGTDATLASSTFTQGGTAIAFTLASDDDDTSPFKGFSVPISYTYLYGFVGDYRAIQQFTAGVNYALTKYVSVKTSYTSGRNVDTFEKQSLYKMSIGLKY